MREPLLMALDGDEGSVGSEDTTNCSLSDFGDFDSRGPAERREPLGGGSFVVDEAEVCGFEGCCCVGSGWVHLVQLLSCLLSCLHRLPSGGSLWEAHSTLWTRLRCGRGLCKWVHLVKLLP